MDRQIQAYTVRSLLDRENVEVLAGFDIPLQNILE
jgi:hypothetical protein